MPANLPPTYHAAEERLRAASGPEEKLPILREMLALLPKHKGTDKLQADLRRRISKLQGQASQQRGARRTTFDHVPREGAGQVVLVGPPNAGKSALLAALTHADPKVAPYPYTTRVPQPGMMPFEDIQIQLVDTPAISSDLTEPWLPGLVRAADLALLVVDPTDPEVLDQIEFILRRLPESRVRLVAPGRVSADGPEDGALGALDVEVPALVAATRADRFEAALGRQLIQELLETTLAGAALPLVAVSASAGDGLELLRTRVFETLRIVRVYTKEPGREPDRARPFALPAGSTVLDLAGTIHRDLVSQFRFARVWGGARFDGQPVEREYVLADGDVIEIHA
ncbi:MAG: TGS domain-containing protein [Candidatus Eiseniibacteriota bacterium]|jgi:ribosome-interacting GTPase 1